MRFDQIVHRSSPEWAEAWDNLVFCGFKREDFMLMHQEEKFYAFKNIDTRKYLRVPKQLMEAVC